MKKRILLAALLALMPALALGAGVTIWGATNRAPATGTMRVPVDTAANSSPGYLSINDIKTYALTDAQKTIGSTSIVCAGGAPQTNTGTTSEFFYTTSCVIPANAMGANGYVEVYALFTFTNNANAKSPRIRFGGTSGTAYLANSATSTATGVAYKLIQNRGAANSQVGANSSFVTFGTSSGASVTSSVDTTADTTVKISTQLASASDSAVLEQYWVRVTYQP